MRQGCNGEGGVKRVALVGWLGYGGEVTGGGRNTELWWYLFFGDGGCHLDWCCASPLLMSVFFFFVLSCSFLSYGASRVLLVDEDRCR